MSALFFPCRIFAGQFLWRGRAARSYISAVGLAFHFFCIGTAQEKLTLPVCFWAFFLLYFLSHFLWDIRFVGNLYYTDETIRDFLEEEGIQYGMWTNQIVCNDLEQAIRIRYPEITWVSAQISGTRMIIQMKENFSGTDSTEIKNAPGDLAAAEDGVITSMIVRQGTPLVKPGDEVKAGQVLVSGRIPIHDDSGEVVAEEETTADADVYAELSIPYVWEHSRYREERIVTGKYPCGISLQIGSYPAARGPNRGTGRHVLPVGDGDAGAVLSLFASVVADHFPCFSL